jgi:hypothetical protein
MVDDIAKTQNTEHPPPRFQQVTRYAGVAIAFFAIPTMVGMKPKETGHP